MSEPEQTQAPSLAQGRSGADYPAGATLANILEQRGPMSEPELVQTFLEVLQDLELAHSQAMLHRDISPSRVIFEGGKWKLTDYGIASVGAVRYMSPERCQRRTVDTRSDTYSLGVVLFEAATGKPPFDAEMNFQVIDAQINKPAPAPSSIRPSVSHDMERVILRALAKNPTNRFQTAAEFRRALEGMKRAGEVKATKGEPQARTGRRAVVAPARRTVRVKPVVIILPILLVLAGAAAYYILAGGGLGAGVPSVMGMSRDEADQALKARGLAAEFSEADDTMAAGIVVAQLPAAGARASGSRTVEVTLSTGLVGVPTVAGLSLVEASERMQQAGLNVTRVDSQYSDSYAAGMVVSTTAKASARLAPHTNLGLVLSTGRATCAQCGARRETGARFCTRCGYKF
jgi:serine/threonine-protein kinase